MILDTSAILALLFAEPEAERMANAVARASVVAVAAPTLVEAGVVLGAAVGFGNPLLERFLHESGALIVPFTETHWRTALSAYERYGKGRHPAKLNLGDCFAYAAAKRAGLPLLCKGNDFPLTDLELANY
jgi:ribonuclease VapC